MLYLIILSIKIVYNDFKLFKLNSALGNSRIKLLLKSL